ncbi:MAG: lysophospholipid acyltransferase family protein [Acidobacteriota bacterium]|nr:1-acyl-sn-glycerol-3-phosphate acyltransferase [Acidobacteriota bacterium]
MPPSGRAGLLEMILLYSLYAWIAGGVYVLLICLLVLLLSLFLPPRTYDPLFKAMCRFLFRLLFIRVRREGAEQISSGQNYLFMANHVSIFDIPLIEGFIPTFLRGIEASPQFRWPVYGWVIRRLGNISIDRNNIHSSIRSMKIAEEYIRSNKSLIVLPEGHRTLDGKLGTFKRLPFYLAKQVEIPIFPIGFSGVFRLKHKGSYLIRPSKIFVRFGNPIDAATIRSSTVDELASLVRARIQELISD